MKRRLFSSWVPMMNSLWITWLVIFWQPYVFCLKIYFNPLDAMTAYLCGEI
ncbi:hypothetical protein ACFLS9_02540 [Bacteroidota bacterium]